MLYPSAMWALDSSFPDTARLAEHILSFGPFLESRESVIRALSSEGEINMFCFYELSKEQGGIHLPSHLCKTLGELGISVTLDVYMAESDEA